MRRSRRGRKALLLLLWVEGPRWGQERPLLPCRSIMVVQGLATLQQQQQQVQWIQM
jgi:hypothetical protein